MLMASHYAVPCGAPLFEDYVHASGGFPVRGVNVISYPSSRRIQIHRIVSRNNHHHVDLVAPPTDNPIRPRTTRAILERLVSELIHLLPNKLFQPTVRERDIDPGRLNRALESTSTFSVAKQTIEVPHLSRRGNTRRNLLYPPLRRHRIIHSQKYQSNMILIETRKQIPLNLTPG